MHRAFLLSPILFLAAACTAGDGGPADEDGPGDTLDTQVYAFAHADSGLSSVSYTGQTFRHLLVDDMKSHIGGLTERIDGGWVPLEGEVEAELDFYFSFDSDAYGSLEHLKRVDGEAMQTTYDEVSTGKDLVSKIAGNDPTGQSADWSVELVGWGAPGSTAPEALVRQWMAELDAAAVARGHGDFALSPAGVPVTNVATTADGRDLQQLLAKFTRGAVAFSQASDDYLDDDLADKGLNAPHDVFDEDAPYTQLEHGWDEGFGYFGAAFDYGDWTDDQVADVGSADRDGDGLIDLRREVNWGHSVNCAKRDRGAVVATDFRGTAWRGFLEGRSLLSATAGQGLSSGQAAQLRAHRDAAILGWEMAIAATVVHYINDTLADMGAIGSDAYVFEDHAKHWSELKGFALLFQFNPGSPMSAAEFAELHERVGMAPALEGDDLGAYADDLRAARGLIGTVYGFDPANLGDEDGQDGW